MQGFASKENILVWGPCFTNGAAWFSGKFWSVQAMGGINVASWQVACPHVWKIVVRTLYSKQTVCR